MGASSVTGVSGAGSAEKSGSKGPGNGRNAYVSLVTPHVVTAGKATLSSGTVTVTFATPLPGGAAKHVVMVTEINSAVVANAPVVSAMTDNSDGDLESITIKGTSSDVVHYAVITTGVA